jgi:ABC-type cobalamin/Fe3+-siderophores transport system ATPase subunit
MIIGTFLRYYKTYQGINYIPITDEDKFCGLVGNNGIGKSSVLESLDTFFNSRPWNFNTATKKSGKSVTKPQIVPVFLLERSYFDSDDLEKAELLNSVATTISENDVSPSLKSHAKAFVEHRVRLTQRMNLTDLLIIPLGFDYKGDASISLFNNRLVVEKLLGDGVDPGKTSLDEEELKCFLPLLNKIKEIVDYIYIPREIEPELFTKLETNEIQVLMGETLTQILSERVTQNQINEINTSLNSFIDGLSQELEIYSYRTPTDRQQYLKKNDVYNLIIQSFFSTRKLHKKQGDNWLEISSLSSGEKQKAIIDVAHSLLSKHRDTGANLIIGIDEPESSLHMSACFDQFDALYEISRDTMQVVFSSHWYGFLPTIETGSATVISKNESSHIFDMINLANYREQIKQLTASSRGRLPYDIRLKSINDFVQSVITSAIGDTPFNWIICEGSSEKIYLSAYFKDMIESKRLRIVPVGGAKEIKRLYSHLSTSYEDFQDEISGKIILLSDTDPQLVNYDVKNYPNLFCRRMVNCEKTRSTKLVNIQANPVSPATEIEDALNGKLFYETLCSFVGEYPENLDFLDEIAGEISQVSSKIALDLKASQWAKIEQFFDLDNNKFLFSKRYVEAINEEHTVPSWIEEIRGWLS